MNGKLFGAIVASAVFCHPLTIWAAVIMEQMVQQGGSGTIALGQSLTTPAGGPWNNLTFNWFNTGGAPNPGTPNPIAVGTLFLLSQEYLGTPGALNAATAGYIAQSQNIASGMYVFGPGATIQPNTTYFFYTNQTVPNNSGDGDVIPGSAYGNVGSGGTYVKLPGGTLGGVDARFRLQGSVVPEPHAGLLAMAISLAALARRRSRLP
jgi:hypothetical protein